MPTEDGSTGVLCSLAMSIHPHTGSTHACAREQLPWPRHKRSGRQTCTFALRKSSQTWRLRDIKAEDVQSIALFQSQAFAKPAPVAILDPLVKAVFRVGDAGRSCTVAHGLLAESSCTLTTHLSIPQGEVVAALQEKLKYGLDPDR